MLCCFCYVTSMSRGASGRIVIEVNPELKRRLYAALSVSGSTLKDWFVMAATRHCEEAEQPDLFVAAPREAKEPSTRGR
jgi:hypothetical protein